MAEGGGRKVHNVLGMWQVACCGRDTGCAVKRGDR